MLIVDLFTLHRIGKPMIEETMVAVIADHGGYKDTHDITPPFIAEVFVPLLIQGKVFSP